jgi:hypothetical protein
MKKAALIFLSMAHSALVTAQVVFKTILKPGPVAVGESFQVQFVLEDIDRHTGFYPPDFKDFRFISGPYVYEGSAFGTDGPRKMRNFVYTLEAIRPGRFIMRGASAKVDDHFIQSDDALIEVISKSEAAKRGTAFKAPPANAVYFLRPGEDPYEKIRRNLFLKVMVDKKTCLVGQPVTATFKLYSRLVSRSDIVKNPGFYGFTVQDIVGLNDRQSAIETIDGNKFDVHTIRKVQLYPLRPGLFIIDPMEVSNKVEFSRSIVNRRTEVEIEEGVFPDNNPAIINTESYESHMSTKPIAISVKSPPSRNQPADYTGAMGHFFINTRLSKNDLVRNEEGELTIKISGEGNFTQLAVPVIQWPHGIEGFEPQVTDTLEHSSAPLRGTRTFRFSFVSVGSGNYMIPVTSFSFFDPDSNLYKTITIPEARITVSDGKKITEREPGVTTGSTVFFNKKVAWLTVFTIIAFIGAYLLWLVKKRKTAKEKPVLKKELVVPGVAEILRPATMISIGDDKLFYAGFRSCIWNFFALHFALSGSKMNRQNLLAVMNQRQVDENLQFAILELLQQCETGIFADARITNDRKLMLEKAHEILSQISRHL